MRDPDLVHHRPISWERARGIFGNPRPPRTVWQRQFDGFDQKLRELARTPVDQIDPSDLGYYYLDLTYVELQPELFAHLFPACLMDWHFSLMRNQPCSHGGAEFHRALHHQDVLSKMATPEQNEGIHAFLLDSFLTRLDAERGFTYSASKTAAYGWISRFNSLGIVMPGIDRLWVPWWSVPTAGRAVALLQYCSGLMYFEGENPMFAPWTRLDGGGGPYLDDNDSHIYHCGWMESNLRFLRETLHVEAVNDGVERAAARLVGEPEYETARRVRDDLPQCQELLALRVAELPMLLSQPPGVDGWSI